ncbi:hypothetical protein ACTA71_003997 [Dictyostelium dimigraforme]
MGKLNRIYERLFNSPRNFDSISVQKTKHLLFQFCFLGFVGWIIFFIVLAYDVLNREVFISTEIMDTIQVPAIKIFLEQENMDYYSINNLPKLTNFNELNYNQVESCFLEYDLTYNCSNTNIEENKIINYTVTDISEIDIEPFNITFQNTYLSINFQSLLENNTNQNLAFVLYFGDFLYFLVGPMKIELLFKIEIVNNNGVETIKYVPTLITTLLDDLLCETYNNSLEFRKNCSSNTISIIYQSNIVPIYTFESNLELSIRILSNAFSIGKLVLVLISLAITFISTKFLFNKKTDWFHNSIRDAVLFHFNHYILEDDKPIEIKKSKIKKKIQSKEKKDQQENELLINNNENEITMGSKNKFHRLFQNIPPQDKYSIPLSRFTMIQFVILGLILLGVGTFISVKDIQSRLVTTTYYDMDFIDLPSFTFTFESIKNSTNTTLLEWEEELPDGTINYCKVIYINPFHYRCESPLNYTEKAIFEFPKIRYNDDNGSISLGRNQVYSLSFYTLSHFISYVDPSKDLTYAIFYLNEIPYFIKPYSNISIVLTKSMFHRPNGTTMESYDPSITVLPFDTDTVLSAYSGLTEIHIWFSSNIVKEIYQETNLQLLQRTVTDFLSFLSPISTIIGLLFTRILIKFYFKYSTAHVDYPIREAIIYHLRNYDQYKSIFRFKENNNNLTIN